MAKKHRQKDRHIAGSDKRQISQPAIKTPEKISAEDPDILGDICPVCGLGVADDEEWTLTDHKEVAHLFCVEKP